MGITRHRARSGNTLAAIEVRDKLVASVRNDHRPYAFLEQVL